MRKLLQIDVPPTIDFLSVSVAAVLSRFSSLFCLLHCTRCPVFVNTRPFNSKPRSSGAVCHTPSIPPPPNTFRIGRRFATGLSSRHSCLCILRLPTVSGTAGPLNKATSSVEKSSSSGSSNSSSARRAMVSRETSRDSPSSFVQRGRDYSTKPTCGRWRKQARSRQSQWSLSQSMIENLIRRKKFNGRAVAVQLEAAQRVKGKKG
ncbi:hypothetical protein K0M31_009236 [Melipona bicolor]|uniref:Uncharacterized protein n=1 Tax=Melipona bicolor TaxID=60889 RepID=A0AA40FPT7_9HYME|nr:hypothetical protein K0M31_009236 [Melipona bicolor]